MAGLTDEQRLKLIRRAAEHGGNGLRPCAKCKHGWFKSSEFCWNPIVKSAGNTVPIGAANERRSIQRSSVGLCGPTGLLFEPRSAIKRLFNRLFGTLWGY